MGGLFDIVLGDLWKYSWCLLVSFGSLGGSLGDPCWSLGGLEWMVEGFAGVMVVSRMEPCGSLSLSLSATFLRIHPGSAHLGAAPGLDVSCV